MFVIEPTFILQIIATSGIIFFLWVLNIFTFNRVYAYRIPRRDRTYMHLHIRITINGECWMEKVASWLNKGNLMLFFSNISDAIHFPGKVCLPDNLRRSFDGCRYIEYFMKSTLLHL